MDNSGYIKMYRSLMKKGYYKDSEYVHLWLHLIFKATYQNKEYLFNNKIEHLKPGQFITGRNILVKETGINRSKIERALKCFESEQQIEQQTTNKFRIITICNWEEYQIIEQQNEQPVSSQRAASEQPVSTIKKEKKDKNIKNKDIGFILPEDIFPETWNAFIEMRKSIKAPLTEKAKELIIKKLETIGQDKNAVLNQSIENSYRGVFPLKDNNNGNQTQLPPKDYAPAYKESDDPYKEEMAKFKRGEL